VSALLQDHQDDLATTDDEIARSLQTVYPLQTVFPHRVWTFDSYALPIPKLAQRVVRNGRTWRLAVHAAIERYAYPAMREREFREREQEYRELMHTLVYDGPDSDALARLILRLFPIARCRFAGCREPYLRYSQQVLHCCDDCRRMQVNPNYGTRAPQAPRLDACVICGGALQGKQRRYCRLECRRRGRHLKEGQKT
jgi:hypothetical protein